MDKKNKKRALIAGLFLVAMLLGVGTGAAGALYMDGGLSFGVQKPSVPQSNAQSGAANSLPASSGTQAESQPAAQQPQSDYEAIPLPEEMRAMWISFLEWRQLDFSSEESFRSAVTAMFQNSHDMGLNTVIAVVRPFGDALYPGSAFPWSHVIHPQGLQGVDPGFDPLAVMVEEAHARGLRLEAWVNPYRVSNTTNGPEELSDGNPAKQHPEWVSEVSSGLWYDPGQPAVRELVVEGVAEILNHYEVDGIHFDDYFYPESADDTFDEASFAEYGEGQSLAEWRRGNINRMVEDVYAAVKSIRPSASFGISCQGNNENNYNQMYADVRHWMAGGAYVDYVMPQLYWGFAYRTSSGRDTYAFANIAAEWAFYPRQDSVRLYAGLAAYRLGLLKEDGTRDGLGDGGNNEQAEWESGHNLADMVQHLRDVDGFSGFALFRYEFMYQDADELSAAERDALSALLAPAEEENPGDEQPDEQTEE